MSSYPIQEWRFNVSNFQFAMQSRWEEYAEPPALQSHVGYSADAELHFGDKMAVILTNGREHDIRKFAFHLHMACTLGAEHDVANRNQFTGHFVFEEDMTAGIYLIFKGYLDLFSMQSLRSMTMFTFGHQELDSFNSKVAHNNLKISNYHMS